MQRSIVVCLDGTWNKPEARRDMNPEDRYMTNVYKVWETLGGPDLSKEDEEALEYSGALEHLIYVRGVGTDGSAFEETVDGAVGGGIRRKLTLAYRMLSRTYSDGDRIFLFGFSRGAFAARSLAGLIQHCGIDANASYGDINARVYDYLNNESPTLNDVEITYVGVWDTVASILSVDLGFGRHNVLPRNVIAARHALALDERRQEFAPVYWPGAWEGQVQEAWFAGAHSNVGGGYQDQNLSNVAFFWVLQGAVDAGLNVNLTKHIDVNAEKFTDPRNSYLEFWRQRVVGTLVMWSEGRTITRKILSTQSIHESVLDVFVANDGTDFKYEPLAQLATGQKLDADYISANLTPWSF